MRIVITWTLALLIGLQSILPALAATIYVDWSYAGPEQPNGSRERPFRRFSRAYQEAKPGDTIRVRGGEYTNDERNTFSLIPPDNRGISVKLWGLAPAIIGGTANGVDPIFPDSDKDGMSDDFERKHGLNRFDPSDAGLDPDSDGMTNLEEFQRNTDPKDTELVGSLPGQTVVDASGAATFTLPIAIPPGTAGMQPTVSVSVSSRGANGLLGVGGSIAGLSAITRVGKTRAQDGETGGVSFDSGDRFALNGQRLVAIRGTYGADETEYRTEIESFTKVVSYGRSGNGPATFRAWTKAGQILDFGTSDDSQIKVAGDNHVMVWCAKEIRDVAGNFVLFSYAVDRNAGEYWPTRIDYTGNRAANLDPYASLLFEFEGRPDATFGRVGPYPVSQSRRLERIQTRVSDDVVGTYTFRYSVGQATGRSRLESVQLCDWKGVCLPATRITPWTDGDSRPSFVVQPPYRPGPGYFIEAGGYAYLSGDVNGDGRSDLIHLSEEDSYWIWLARDSGGFEPTKFRHRGVQANGNHFVNGDFDGDGRTDFFHVVRPDLAELWSGTASGSIAITPAVAPGFGSFDQNDPLRYYPGDFNGDGRTDLLCIVQPRQAKVLLSEGNSRFQFVDVPVSEYRIDENDDNFFPCDLNGDGLADFVHFNPSDAGALPDEYWTWLSTGDGRFAISRHTVPGSVMSKNESKFQSGDFNGDGRTDFLHYFRPDLCEVWLQTTGGDFDRRTIRPQDLGVALPGYHFEGRDGAHFEFHIGDFNGDGRTDIIHIFDKSTVLIWRSLGNGRFTAGNVILAGPNAYSLAGENDKFRFQLGDFNGDGQSDFIHFHSNEAAYVWQRSDRLADLPRAVVDGYGNRVELDYEPLTTDGVYTPRTDAVYPVTDIQGPLYVVAEHRMSDGRGEMYEIQHEYRGARADLTGRGFLGFEAVMMTDSRTGIRTSTRYRQEFPFIGQPSSGAVRQRNGRLITRSESQWESRALGGGRHFVFNSKTVSQSYELDGPTTPYITTTTDTEFDDFGNPKRIVIDSGDGHKKTMVNEHRNDTSSWRLGRLTRAALTGEAPNVPTRTRVSAFDYNSNGLLEWEEIEPERPDFTLRTTYAYDEFGNTTNATVTGGRIETRSASTVYNQRGRFPTVTRNALGYPTTYRYDARLGLPVSITDPNSLEVTIGYDGFGRKLSENRFDGTHTYWAHLPPGSDRPSHAKFMTRILVRGQEPETTFQDSLGRVVRTKEIGFGGDVVFQDTVYDEHGRVERASRPYFKGGDPVWTRYLYDLLGRTKSKTLPDDSATTTDYAGLVTTITDPLKQTQILTENSQGQIVAIRDNEGKTLRHQYDCFGNLLKSTDSVGNETTATYDIRGRKQTLTEPGLKPWSYSYNVLGELIEQANANGQVVAMSYDLLGRLLNRSDPEGSTDFKYDEGTKAIGQLSEVSAPNGYKEVYEHDDFGRISRTTTTIGGEEYSTQSAYDHLSRLSKLTYPSGFAVTNRFNERGFLAEVSSLDNSGLATPLWRMDRMNAAGQATQESFGNGVVTKRTFNRSRGWLRTIKTGGSSTIQDLEYDFNHVGSLKWRKDHRQNLVESFEYDGLNRLTLSTILGHEPVEYRYNEIGNLRFKTGVGTYTYGGVARSPYAVARIDGQLQSSYDYDDNGNQVGGAGRTLKYTSFDKPQSISRDSQSITFEYGPGRERLKQVSTVHGKSIETTYVGSIYEEVVVDGSMKELRHYISAGGRLVAIQTHSTPATGRPSNRTRFVHNDHLGSLESLTDDDGDRVESFSFTYDPHGRRRSSSWSQTPGENFQNVETERGFGQHLQLDAVDLVHMGGRLYDPLLGRFLSSDVAVQAPLNQQSFNRYSYVLNNPLSYTDPSGYFFDNLEHFGREHGRFYGSIAAGVAVSIVSGGLGAPAALSAGLSAATTTAIASKGNARAIAISGVLAAASTHALQGGASGATQRGDIMFEVDPRIVSQDGPIIGGRRLEFSWKRGLQRALGDIGLLIDAAKLGGSMVALPATGGFSSIPGINALDNLRAGIFNVPSVKAGVAGSLTDDPYGKFAIEFVLDTLGGGPRPKVNQVRNVAAKTTPSLEDLSKAAGATDRGGLTAAGRSLTKHGAGARSGNTLFPAAKGNPSAINQSAQDVVDDILTTPGTTIQSSTRGRFGPTIEVTAPDGRGIVYDANGGFLFFKE